MSKEFLELDAIKIDYLFFCDIWVTGISFLSFCRYSRSKDKNILAKLMCQCYQINLRWGKNFIYIPPGAKICTSLDLVWYKNFYLGYVMFYFYMLILFVIPLINNPKILCKILIPIYILSRKSLFYQRNNVCTALNKYYNDANLSNIEIRRSYSNPRLPDIHSFCLQPSPILFRLFLLIFC